MLLRLFLKKNLSQCCRSYNLLRIWQSFFIKKGVTKCCKSLKNVANDAQPTNSVNVQSQVFRVLLMTQRLRQKKRKVANTAELSKCCRNNKCLKYVRFTRSAGLTMQ